MNDPQVLVLAVAAIALSAAWLLLLRWRSPGLPWRQMLYPAVPIVWVVLMSQRQVFDPGLRDALERATLMGVTIWALLTAVWALGTVMRNHSIMDIAYPLTPWAATSLAWVQWGSNSSPHLLVLLALMSVWAWRLAGYLAVRYLPHGEEARYARWRERGGPHWLWCSYFQIHLTQGVLIWMWSWPLALALGTTEAHPVWTWAAIAAWTVVLARVPVGVKSRAVAGWADAVLRPDRALWLTADGTPTLTGDSVIVTVTVLPVSLT